MLPFVQHTAKHALWALSQQTLPHAITAADIACCCALLLEHMQLPVHHQSSTAARRCAMPQHIGPALQQSTYSSPAYPHTVQATFNGINCKQRPYWAAMPKHEWEA